MRVLVTGGTGVVGKPAVDRLLARGHTVRLFSRHAERDARQWVERVEPWEGSVGDEQGVRSAAEGCDVVLHVAGIEVEDPPEVTFERINVQGTRMLLDEAERAGARRFVFVSSLGAERGSSGYHRSKLAAERLVHGFSREWAVLRPGNVYGPGDQVISVLLQMVRTLPAVPVIGAGDQPFQPVWAEDLGQALALAVESRESGQVLELAGREVTTLNQLLDVLEEVTGRSPARIPVPAMLAEMGTQALEQLGVEFPVNRDQLIMLQEGSVIRAPEGNALVTVLGVEPIPLAEGIRRLATAQPEVLPSEGVGELHRQRYWADIHGSSLTPEQLILLVRLNLDAVTPDGLLDVGAEPVSALRLERGATVSMNIPVRGIVQVRVEEVTEKTVTLSTLEGHHVAGVIRFDARAFEDGRVRFEICSYTRAATWLDEVIRQVGGRYMQLGGWSQTVQSVVERSGGQAPEGVQVEEEVLEERQAERVEEWARELVLQRKREQG